jgi:hypothetical protein
MCGFCTALRGEEHTLIKPEGTAHSLDRMFHPTPGLKRHFELVLSGPTKSNRLSGARFPIPCVAITTGSRLRPGIWLKRYIHLLRLAGRRGGYLFGKDNGSKPKLCQFDNDFYSVLEDVQAARADLLAATVYVQEKYGILRSLRRGVTGHATNMEVPEKTINAVNRWRKEMGSNSPSLTLSEMYADLNQIKPTILRYSDAL